FIAYSWTLELNLGPKLWESLETFLYATHWSRAFEFGTSKYLGHTWSLGIEETFYVLWPPIVCVVLWMRGGRLLPGIAIGFFCAAAAWKIWFTLKGAGYMHVTNGFDTRCDSVLIGCALAFAGSRLSFLWPLGIAGLAVLFAIIEWQMPQWALTSTAVRS